jgi:hypothetical protein
MQMELNKRAFTKHTQNLGSIPRTKNKQTKLILLVKQNLKNTEDMKLKALSILPFTRSEPLGHFQGISMQK